jgi:hypothetical protein
LAINTRIEDDDAGLLYWLEFTVVTDDCEAFAPDLGHYREHVKRLNTHPARPTMTQCPL